MPIEEFISKLSPPFSDLNDVVKVLNCYNGQRDFYSQLVRANFDPSANSGYNHVSERDRFYAGMLNTWIRNIVSMKSEEFYKNYGKKAEGVNFTKLRNLLAGVPKFTAMQQVLDFLYKTEFDDDIKNFIRNYNSFDAPSSMGWDYIATRYMDGYRTKRFYIGHRLYIGIDSYYVHRFANEFIAKCLKRNLAFELKFDCVGNRDDDIVIYCSDQNLPLFVAICEEIRKENPLMEGHIRKPPILTGVYNGWIGYGAEPQKERESFNTIRASAIEKVLDDEAYQFFRALQGQTLTTNGVEYKIEDYIAYLVYKRKLEFMKSDYEWRRDKGRDVSKYNIALLSDKSYLTNLRRTINEFVNNHRRDLCYPNINDSIKFPGIDGGNISISVNDMLFAARNVFKSSVSQEKAYLERIRTRILTDAPKHGISKNNYMMNESFETGIDGYRKEKATMHRVTSARVAKNFSLYQQYFKLLEVMYGKLKRDDRDGIKMMFEQLNLLKRGMERIDIKSYSYSASDIHERTQYYLYCMAVSLNKLDLGGYEYYRSLYYNYELEANKKL